MSQVLSGVTEWVIQVTFVAGVAFPLVYSVVLRYRWWETVTGRVMVVLGPCVSGTLLGPVLAVWGVPLARGHPGWVLALAWFYVACLTGVAVVLSVLGWEAFRQALRDRPSSRAVSRVLWLKNKR